jgi:hypothetical protein
MTCILSQYCCWHNWLVSWLTSPVNAAAAAVVFFGRQKMEESTKWMGAFWLSIAGARGSG